MLKIGELSKRSGLTKRTIDYYTNLGLLEVSYIESNRYRQYGEDNLHRIKLIEYYKAKHLTLDEIKAKLEVIYCVKDLDIRSKVERIWSKLEEAETDISELKTLVDDAEQLKHIIEDLCRSKHTNLQSITFLLEML